MYGHTKSSSRVPAVKMGTSDTSAEGERTNHQGFLSGYRDKKKLILLLAEEVTGDGLRTVNENGRVQQFSTKRMDADRTKAGTARKEYIDH